MLWFQPMPWGRWALVVLVASTAVYIEFRPETTIEAPFATMPITMGDVVDETNTESRRVPVGLFDPAELGEVAKRAIPAGAPVLASDVTEQGDTIPAGWWVIGVTLPAGTDVGEEVRLVLLDSGDEVPGVVANPGSDDPFAAADGGVAVPPDSSAQAAVAAAAGRVAVLVSSGG
jgi:hypothetical protein